MVGYDRRKAEEKKAEVVLDTHHVDRWPVVACGEHTTSSDMCLNSSYGTDYSRLKLGEGVPER